MSDSTVDTARGAEKAYSEGASEVKAVSADKASDGVTRAEEPAAPVAPAPKPSVVAKKTAEPKKPARKASRKSHKSVAKPEAAKAIRTSRVARSAGAMTPVAATGPKPTVTELKEKIMATAKTTDFAKPIADAVGEFQNRTKAAYDKGAEVATEVTDLTKGNVEALVESSKIFATGAQSLGKTYADEAKSAYETMTADLKEFAAVKSPTELFQLQGKIARRNFDAFVATTSKNTEAFVKLANEAAAPLTGRVDVATEKLSKVA